MFQITFSPLFRQYACVIIVNLSVLCVGLDLVWTSPVLVKLRDPEETPLSRPITDDEGGWIVSIGYVFSILTLPCVGYLLDHIGRKYTTIVATAPKVVAGLLTIFATEVWMLMVARAITGVSNTATMLIVMIYCTEIASKQIRGGLGSIIPILSCIGSLAMLGIGPYITYLNLCIMFTAIVTISSISLTFVPDTPYSLYILGKTEEARKVLTYLRGSDALAEEELKEFTQTEPEQKLDMKEIFKNKANRKAFIIAIVMGIGFQAVGFNSILFYLQTILEYSNTNVSPSLGSLLIGCIQLSASVCTSVVSDRFGRKVILVAMLFCMALGMVGLGIFFILKQNGTVISGFLNYLPLISLAVITWTFSGGIGSQYFVLITELLDGPARAIGTSAAFLTTTLVLFGFTKYMMELMTAMGPEATFLMFAANCVVIALFILIFVPETKQKTIAEIQMALSGKCKKREESEKGPF